MLGPVRRATAGLAGRVRDLSAKQSFLGAAVVLLTVVGGFIATLPTVDAVIALPPATPPAASTVDPVELGEQVVANTFAPAPELPGSEVTVISGRLGEPDLDAGTATLTTSIGQPVLVTVPTHLHKDLADAVGRPVHVRVTADDVVLDLLPAGW